MRRFTVASECEVGLAPRDTFAFGPGFEPFADVEVSWTSSSWIEALVGFTVALEFKVGVVARHTFASGSDPEPFDGVEVSRGAKKAEIAAPSADGEPAVDIRRPVRLKLTA